MKRVLLAYLSENENSLVRKLLDATPANMHKVASARLAALGRY